MANGEELQAILDDFKIDQYAKLIATFLRYPIGLPGRQNEAAIEAFEKANPGIEDAYYKRERAKPGNTHHTL